ncbi:MAG: cobalamin-dependent protein, partial [Chloroflexi bacterium]|nr:cobalamin-dependent protein [Chloroflexota bacterium]
MQRPPRFVIATPICDGHDVAAAAITRILRAQGAEAVYVGFNKSAYQIAKAASEEDATGIAVSTYNGGHMSFLREVLAEQARQGIPHVPLFAGGGGTILEREVAPLLRMGVTKVYRPPLDLAEAVRDMTTLANNAAKQSASSAIDAVPFRALAQRLTAIEWEGAQPAKAHAGGRPVVWGIGGRGGAGKSTLIDELLLRFLRSTEGRVAVLTADPTLGDRLRMVHCYSPRVFVRSVRVGPGDSTEASTAPLVDEMRAHGFDLILVESVGLGQNELGVAPVADASVFCMTPEYGSDVQLEKEALLRRADLVVMNKRDFPQAEARYARVRRFVGDNKRVFLTEAKRFGDPGVTALFAEIARRSGLPSPSPSRGEGARASTRGGEGESFHGKPGTGEGTRIVGWGESPPPVPFSRRGYLGTVVDAHEGYYAEVEDEAALASNGGASRDYQAEYDRIWQTYGFDGDLSGAVVEDGVAYRETPNGRVPVARETTTGIWIPVLGLPDHDARPRPT